VCLVPGAGDNKTNFKWRLAGALLAEGLTVLTIDSPGHGTYRERPLAFPDCLTAVSAAVNFLQQQPGVTQVGLVGVSLGGALALKSLATAEVWPATPPPVAALAVVATPTHLKFNRALVYRVMWHTFFRAPILSLFKEINARQARQSWLTGGYRSGHSTAEMFDLLDPLGSIARLKGLPTLLVYSRRDAVSPPAMARAMQQAAPWAEVIESLVASHVTLILLPEVNQSVARWLRQQLR
jgi:pimeloyl-ACP methyl ester carboxylesterase